MIRRSSNHWKFWVVLFPIIGTCALANFPGGMKGFFGAWWGEVAAISSGLPDIPTNGLVVWMRPSTSLSASNQYGSSLFDGILTNGMEIVSGEGFNSGTNKNKAVYFNGSPATAAMGTNGWTVAGWFKRVSGNNEIHYLFSELNRGIGGAGLQGIHFRWQPTDLLYIEYYFTSGSIYRGRSISAYTFPTNTWIHFAATYTPTNYADNASYKIYVNGVQSDNQNSSAGTPTAFVASTNNLQLMNSDDSAAAFGFGHDRGLRGYSDELVYYVRGLSSSEVYQVYSETLK